VLDKIDGYVELRKDFRIYSDSSRIAGENMLGDSIKIVQSHNKSLQELLEEELLKTKTIDTMIVNPRIKDSVDALFTDNIDKPIDEDLKPLDEGREILLENIEYDFDKSTLRSVSKKELNNLVAILKENKDIKIEISSHTDASRNVAMATSILKGKGLEYSAAAHDEMSKKYNNRLSQQRANSVVNYLIAKGIPKSRLVAKGYGEENPVASNDTNEGKQKNRRTEFKVLEGK